MHPPAPTTPLYLASHVRARECGGQVVLLDLRCNRYVGVGHQVAVTLEQCVDGWPSMAAAAPDDIASQAAADVSSVVKRFESQGLLTRTPVSRPLDAHLAVVDASLDFEDLSSDIETGAYRLARFLRGAAVAACRLRFQSLDTISRAVSERRQRGQRGQEQSSSTPSTSMRASAIAYERLRPFLITARKKCLFDSVSMLEFLASEGLFPHWVIGVKTGPFGAHAWVQCGSTVLNDQHARVRQFQPILVA